MAWYTNSEQVFINILARLPTDEEWVEIRALLKIMAKAEFAVDHPSNAPQVELFAWWWARSTGRAESLAAIKAAVLEIAAKAHTVDLAPVLDNLKSLRATLEKPANEKAPVRVKIDMSDVRGALSDSFSLAWFLVAGAMLGLAFWAGTSFEQYELAPAFTAQQKKIDQLTAQLLKPPASHPRRR